MGNIANNILVIGSKILLNASSYGIALYAICVRGLQCGDMTCVLVSRGFMTCGLVLSCVIPNSTHHSVQYTAS